MNWLYGSRRKSSSLLSGGEIACYWPDIGAADVQMGSVGPVAGSMQGETATALQAECSARRKTKKICVFDGLIALRQRICEIGLDKEPELKYLDCF